MPEPNEVFARRLQMLAEEKNVKQAQIAELLKVSAAAVSRYFKGRVPSIEMLEVLARYFGVSVEYLVGFTDDPHGTVAKETPAPYKIEPEEGNIRSDKITEITELLRARARKLSAKELRIIELILDDDPDKESKPRGRAKEAGQDKPEREAEGGEGTEKDES